MPKTNESSSPKPEAEKPMETDQKPSIKPETTAEETTAAAPSSGDSAKDISDIQNMEKLVNGLNGSSASKFGISHNNNDQQISAWLFHFSVPFMKKNVIVMSKLQL